MQSQGQSSLVRGTVVSSQYILSASGRYEFVQLAQDVEPTPAVYHPAGHARHAVWRTGAGYALGSKNPGLHENGQLSLSGVAQVCQLALAPLFVQLFCPVSLVLLT